MTRRVVLPLVVAALVVATVGVALVGAVTRGHDGAPSTAAVCADFARTSADRAAHDVGSGPRVVVIGDSFSVGYGLADPSTSWPSRLAAVPASVHVAGFSGSGFAEHDSACGEVSYPDRAADAVAGGADVVVVEGGLNDWKQPGRAIRAGFERLLVALRGHDVVVAGPTSAPARIEETARVDRVLRLLSRRHPRVTYVSMLDDALPGLTYLDDRLHLTQQGQDAFGDRVADVVRRVLRARGSPRAARRSASSG